MSFTVPVYQAPYGDTFQGPIEPDDISDNSPLSLYVLCCKYFVQNISKISINRRIPSDICDNLIELFRIYGSKKACNTFLNSLSCKQCSVVSANLSNLDITDEDLIDFLDSQSQTLKSLNISNCNRLSSNVLQQVNRTLLKVHDTNQINRLVTIYEVPEDRQQIPKILAKRNYPFVIRKFYSNGKIRTDINKDYPTACPESYVQNSIFLRQEFPKYSRPTLKSNPFINMTTSTSTIEQTCSITPRTSYEFNREMGLFCHPSFTKEFFSQNEPNSFACYDRAIDDHRFFHSNYIPCTLIDADKIIRSKDKSLFPEEIKLEKNQCKFCYGSGLDRQTILILPKSLYNTLHYLRKIHYSKLMISKLNLNEQSNNNDDENDAEDHGNNLFDVDISAPEDDEDSFLEDEYSLYLPNKISIPILQLNELGYSFNNMHLKNLFSSYDRFFSLNSTLYSNRKTSLRSDDLVINNVDRQSKDFSTKIEAITGLDSSQNTAPNQPSASMSSAATCSGSATSSSCPILSSCAEAAYFNFETDQLLEESTVMSIDECKTNSNNHNFPQILKKFRPHSHNTFDDHHNAQCSRSQIDSVVSNKHNNNNFYDYNNDIPLPKNYSPTFASSSKESDLEHKLTCPLHLLNVPLGSDLVFSNMFSSQSDSDSKCDLNVSEDQLRFELFPYKVYKIEQPDYSFVRLIEIVTWSSSSLESLSVTRSVPPRLEEMRSKLRQSIIMNRDFNKLRRLTIHDWPVNMQDMFFNGCRYLDRITYLDLSHCKSIGDGRSLIQMTNLETLILYNMKETYRAIDSICQLKSLRVLDISNSGDQVTATVRDPITQLRRLITSLPNLTSLDLSGTIMAVGIIAGLAERENNPLEFLGIFHTSVEPSSRSHIPALKIAGDTFEDLILNSCEAYMNRPEMLKKCLNELFQIFRYENGEHDLERAVKILVCSLGRHPSDKMIQVAASATLFYIIKSEEAKTLLGRKIKELIVTRLLDAMQAFRFDQTMLRNGCLNFIHFRIPADVISEYTRLADILLYIVTMDEDDFLQRLGIYLLNSLACQVDGEQKTIVGNLGAIEKMLHLIESRYNRNVCDEVMETAWSTMWNVTDETPINCERFLNHGGMEFFVSCMEKFPENPELLRNMMGLLGNVSECAHLRYRLMKDDYITRFVQLLDSQSDGIEVSYNSAGILAHIASDGAEIWHRHLPTCSRDDMLARMECAISRWEINSRRNINYRSFEPILRLLRVLSISWQAQYWAVWALANLTRVHSNKYCNLLEKDGGVEVLKSFIVSPRPDNFSLPESVKCLAVVTLFQYYLHNRFGNLNGLERSSQIVCFDLIKSKSIVINFLKTYQFCNLAKEIGINYDINDDNINDEYLMNQDIIMAEDNEQ